MCSPIIQCLVTMDVTDGIIMILSMMLLSHTMMYTWRGGWRTLAQQARSWAMWIGLRLQFVLARYGGTGPLGGVLDVRIDQLIGDLLDEGDENYCKY